jgi:hypothetical protein
MVAAGVTGYETLEPSDQSCEFVLLDAQLPFCLQEHFIHPLKETSSRHDSLDRDIECVSSEVILSADLAGNISHPTALQV